MIGKYAHPQTSVLSIPFLRVGCAKRCLRTLERQLEVTGKRFNDVFVFLLGIEPAMNWVLEHMGDPGMTSHRQSQKPFWLRCRACSAELIVCQEKFCNFRHKYETYELRVRRNGANYLCCGTQNDLLWVLVALSAKVERWKHKIKLFSNWYKLFLFISWQCFVS